MADLSGVMSTHRDILGHLGSLVHHRRVPITVLAAHLRLVRNVEIKECEVQLLSGFRLDHPWAGRASTSGFRRDDTS